MTRKRRAPVAADQPAMMADGNNPWGGGDSGGGGNGGSGGKGGGSPWLPPSGGGSGGGGSGGGSGPRRPAGLDDMLKRGPFGPKLPQLPGGQRMWMWIGAGILGLWVLSTSFHVIGAAEEGVVTRLGSYSRTVGPGINITFPRPIERLQVVSTTEIRSIDIPNGQEANFVLTGDANIINLAYTVRWNVRDPERFLFQLDDAEGAVRDAAESAMRATVANFTLAQAIGPGMTEMEGQVQERLQAILNSYGAGVNIEGVAIRRSVPPAEVEEAFNQVNAAKQRSESFLNQARAYSAQVVARAEGDAAQFDRLYEQYRLAPEVTRRRLYFETMERILTKSEKTVVESGGVTPYIALPEVRRRAQQPQQAQQAPAAQPQGGRP